LLRSVARDDSGGLILINAAFVVRPRLCGNLHTKEEQAMAANVGTFDRIARVIVGIVLIAFALGYIAPGTTWSWVGWIGVVPLLTAALGTCPLYSVVGCSTK
jgi:sulfite exporter TauE/SafE